MGAASGGKRETLIKHGSKEPKEANLESVDGILRGLFRKWGKRCIVWGGGMCVCVGGGGESVFRGAVVGLDSRPCIPARGGVSMVSRPTSEVWPLWTLPMEVRHMGIWKMQQLLLSDK